MSDNNNNNMQLFLDTLRGDEFTQATGQLVVITRADGAQSDTEPEIGHCCLGVGETLRLRSLGGTDEQILNELDRLGLPSTKFAEWLGLKVAEDLVEWDPSIKITTKQFLDWLDAQTDLDLDNLALKVKRASVERFGDPYELTCSKANDDWQFTFKQIADLIEKFGLYDPPLNDDNDEY